MRDWRSSLLNGHPEGMGKHLQIFKDERINGFEVISLHELGDIPFYICVDGNEYLAILGSDIACSHLKEDTYSVPLPTQKVCDILNGCKWFLDQAWEYLGWKTDSMTLYMIGGIDNFCRKTRM